MEALLWRRLPPEVQLRTLQNFAVSEYFNGTSLASYSAVSRSWQAIFEPIIFSKLHITLPDLMRFNQIVRGARRKYVQYIGLIIDLPEEPRLDIEVMQGTEEEIAMSQMTLMVLRGRRTYSTLPGLLDQAKKNDSIFTNTLQKFLSIVSSWQCDECCVGGISLEIIASTESYWQKMAGRIRQYEVATKTYTDRGGTRRPFVFRLPEWFWWRVLAVAEFNFHIQLSLDAGITALPKTSVISKLSILRKTIRNVAVPTLTKVINAFPMLKMVEFELRERYHKTLQNENDLHYISQLENWNDDLRSIRLHPIEIYELVPKDSRRSLHVQGLGAALGKRSKDLEYLSVTYAIDIEHFFGASTSRWSSLEVLLLRSAEPFARPAAKDPNSLLVAVSKGIIRMPLLKRMVIYHLTRNEASILRCDISEAKMCLSINYTSRICTGNLFYLWASAAKIYHCQLRWHTNQAAFNIIEGLILQTLRSDEMSSSARPEVGRRLTL